jgi:hypothetical protein
MIVLSSIPLLTKMFHKIFRYTLQVSVLRFNRARYGSHKSGNGIGGCKNKDKIITLLNKLTITFGKAEIYVHQF